MQEEEQPGSIASVEAVGVPIHDPAWAPIGTDYAESTITRRFEERVARAPESIAVTGPGGDLTASQLDRRANQVANAIREAAAPLGRPVAVLHGHDVDLVATMLGVFKAGGILLVLDPASPPEVLASVVADARPAAIVTDTAHRPLGVELAGGDRPVVELDEHLSSRSDDRPPLGTGPESPALLAYTSGTTGDVKAAVIPHRALLHLVR
ncbi:MAG TPA: AMP-binding protein, partial [Acidimicrobiales bacterium]|nr:AMP-binding protein [Acidimicrobiales bacterium]